MRLPYRGALSVHGLHCDDGDSRLEGEHGTRVEPWRRKEKQKDSKEEEKSGCWMIRGACLQVNNPRAFVLIKEVVIDSPRSVRQTMFND
jgi:hypothetical protein